MNKWPVLLLFACLVNARPGLAEDPTLDTAAGVPAAASETAPRPEGMYVGTLPCADCPGIRTFITFYPDGTVAMTSQYEGEEPNSFVERGAWSVNGGLVTASFADDKRHFLARSDAVLEMVGEDGNPSKAMPEAYRLKRSEPMSPTGLAGHYTLSGSDAPQTLTLSEGQDGTMRVSVSSQDCSFTGQGHLVNDRLDVPVRTGDPGLETTMVILPDADAAKVSVFAAKYDDRYALNAFCKDAGTLAGDYAKIR